MLFRSGNGVSSSPALSGDGRYVAFFSEAKNLVANDLTARGEVFWRDTWSGTTLSVSTNGRAAAELSMSGDGRYVAAVSGSPAQLFVWDSQSDAKVYSTLAVLMRFVLSPDGRTLVFYSATNIDNPLIAHDLVTGADRVIGYSVVAAGPKTQISDNGRFVAFAGAANAPSTPPGVANVFLYDLQTETTTLVSFNRDRSGGGNGTSDSPSISADGRYVAFRSSASDLVAGDTNGREDIFLFDRLTGTNRLVSLNQAGAGTGNDRSATPVISANGAVVAFRSLADDLVADDSNETQDVFVFRVPVVTFTDTDGDGMDDAWEMAYWGD